MKEKRSVRDSIVMAVFTVLIGVCLVFMVISLVRVLTLIKPEEAERIAYKDAGIEPPYSVTELKRENGRYQYDIEFYADGIVYHYAVLAKDGVLLSRRTKGSGLLQQQKEPDATLTATETTAPETTVPETTVAETTAPGTTVAETTVPETTVPETEPTTAPGTEPETAATDEARSDEEPDPARVENARKTALSNIGLADRLNDAEFTDTTWTKEGDKFILTFTFTIDDTEYVCTISEHGEFYSSESHPK